MKPLTALEKEIAKRRNHNNHQVGTICAECGKEVDFSKGWILVEKRTSNHTGDSRKWYHPECDNE